MHAASVHPEPGSNSLKKLYIKLYSESAGFRTDFAVLNSLHGLFSLDTVSLELIVWLLLLYFALIYFWFVFQKNCRDLWLSCNLLVQLPSISLWKPHCFVLNLSLVVQFSRTILLAARFEVSYSLLCDSYIISYFEAFVKGFCKSFLSFFRSSVLLNLMSTRIPFRSPRSLRFRSGLLGSLAWRDLYIISYFIAFVKRFSKVFEVFFEPVGSHPSLSLSRSQLKYYTTYPSVCQYLLRIFLRIVIYV